MKMAAPCFSMATTHVLPSLEATEVTALGGGSACLKAPCSRFLMMSLPTAAPLSFKDIPCPPWDFLFDPCFGQEAGPKNYIIGTGFTSGGRSGRGGTRYSFGASRRRSGGATPCIRSFRRKRIEREIGGIQAVQEE